MTNVDFGSFRRLARQGNLVAVFKRIPADLETPVSSFLKLTRRLPYAYLLESAEQGEQIGRYSIIGLEPAEILIGNRKTVVSPGKRKVRTVASSQHMLEILRERMQGMRLANAAELPEFCGGYVGFFAYENVEFFEDIRLHPKPGPKTPESVFYLTHHYLIFDHYRKTLTIVVIVPIRGAKHLRRDYQAALKKITRTIQQLRSPLHLAKSMSLKKAPVFQSNMTRPAFQAKVKRIQEYVRAGDCIQVVLSQRFRMKAPQDDFRIYRALRSINPSPYMFYFRCGKTRLIGTSPELLVKNQGRHAEVRPIAGTRPRGETPAQDHAYRESLLRSPKEMAEHLMLVDLGRNDLGRVCEFNSVKVQNFARVENYSHVMHLVSDVSGKLKPNQNSFRLLQATFPAGTVTGAPKIRAMQIIDELEEEKRGPYAGSLGYFSFNQDMEHCITIRTLVLQGDQLYLQAGAGIVKDSNPSKEYDETVNKAKALMVAIRDQENFQ